MHQGRGFTGSGQYSAVAARLKKSGYIAERLGYQDSAARGQCIRDERFTGSGQYSAVAVEKKNHCSKATRTVHQGRASGEGLQVQDSILLLKKSLRQGYQDSASGTRVYRFRTVFCCEKNHCGKATRTVHQGREVYTFRTVFCC